MSRNQDLRIRDECIGYHHGQSDCVVIATIDRVVVGMLHYSVFRGVTHISMIEVASDRRLSGIASAMVDRLAANHGYESIDWGMVTAEGARLKRAMDRKHGARNVSEQ